MADWRDGNAESIVVYHGTGPLVAFARSGDSWYEARLPKGGAMPDQPAEREAKLLTPDELLDALKAPLGGK